MASPTAYCARPFCAIGKPSKSVAAASGVPGILSRIAACDHHVTRKRIGHVPQPGHAVGPGDWHLDEYIRLLQPVSRFIDKGLRPQPFPAFKIELGSLHILGRPRLAGLPGVGAHRPIFDRRLVVDARLDPLQPEVVPFEHFVVQRVKRAFQMRRAEQRHPLGASIFSK